MSEIFECVDEILMLDLSNFPLFCHRCCFKNVKQVDDLIDHVNSFHAWTDKRYAGFDTNLKSLNTTVATNFKLQTDAFDAKLADVNNTADVQTIRTTMSGVDFDRLKSILGRPHSELLMGGMRIGTFWWCILVIAAVAVVVQSSKIFAFCWKKCGKNKKKLWFAKTTIQNVAIFKTLF